MSKAGVKFKKAWMILQPKPILYFAFSFEEKKHVSTGTIYECLEEAYEISKMLLKKSNKSKHGYFVESSKHELSENLSECPKENK